MSHGASNLSVEHFMSRRQFGYAKTIRGADWCVQRPWAAGQGERRRAESGKEEWKMWDALQSDWVYCKEMMWLHLINKGLFIKLGLSIRAESVMLLAGPPAWQHWQFQLQVHINPTNPANFLLFITACLHPAALPCCRSACRFVPWSRVGMRWTSRLIDTFGIFSIFCNHNSL